MVTIELVTGEPVAVEGDDIRLVAEQLFGGRAPGESGGGLAFFTTTQGAEVCINPAQVVRITARKMP